MHMQRKWMSIYTHLPKRKKITCVYRGANNFPAGHLQIYNKELYLVEYIRHRIVLKVGIYTNPIFFFLYPCLDILIRHLFMKKKKK